MNSRFGAYYLLHDSLNLASFFELGCGFQEKTIDAVVFLAKFFIAFTGYKKQVFPAAYEAMLRLLRIKER